MNYRFVLKIILVLVLVSVVSAAAYFYINRQGTEAVKVSFEENSDGKVAAKKGDKKYTSADFVEKSQWMPIDKETVISLGLTGQTRVIRVLPDKGYNVLLVETNCEKGTYAILGGDRIKSAPTDDAAPTKPKVGEFTIGDLTPAIDYVCGLKKTKVFEGSPSEVAKQIRSGTQPAASQSPIPGAEMIEKIKKMPADQRPKPMTMPASRSDAESTGTPASQPPAAQKDQTDER